MLNIIIWLLLIQLFCNIIFIALIKKKKINVRKRWINVFFIIFFVLVLLTFIINIIKKSKLKKNKIKGNRYIYIILIFSIYIVLNTYLYKFIIKNLFSIKKDNLKSIEIDFKILEKFVRDNTEISSVEELYTKTKDLLDKLSFKYNYVLDENFLYTSDEINIMPFFLAKYREDCSYYQNLYINIDKKGYDKQHNFIRVLNKRNISNIESSKKFITDILNNICKKKRFVFFLIQIKYGMGYCNVIHSRHANHLTVILLDLYKKIVEYFDPNLHKITNTDFNKYTTNCDKEIIPYILKEYFPEYAFINEESTSFDLNFIEKYASKCIRGEHRILGLQYLDGNIKKEKNRYIEKAGYCVNWSWFYLYERLKPENRDLKQTELIKKIIEKFNLNNNNNVKETYIGYIRVFSVFQKVYELISTHYNNIYSKEKIANIAINIFTK